ncbi:MAG: type II secretion system protein [Henriciella sp.]|nr:type II secretion system protein [Henriciella sp.]
MSNASRKSEQGFSLVETVAAMGVLALAAVPLLQVTGDAVRNTARLETRLLARTVAENVMARTMASPDVIDAGIAVGQETQLARTFGWSRLASPALPGSLQSYEVTVTAPNDTQVLARLVSLKAVPKNLPGSSTAEVDERAQ